MQISSCFQSSEIAYKTKEILCKSSLYDLRHSSFLKVFAIQVKHAAATTGNIKQDGVKLKSKLCGRMRAATTKKCFSVPTQVAPLSFHP
eukprot:953284-Pleurochrysis_carterae.AAC.1